MSPSTARPGTPGGAENAGPTPDAVRDALRLAADAARASGLFGPVSAGPLRVECAALASASPASYRLEWQAPGLWVSLVTPDRWLSHSIEADLLHTGDAIEELLEEELVELGESPGRPRVDHFRGEDRLFTFRTPIPRWEQDGRAIRYLLAYEACFRRLGDMEAGE